MQTGKDIKTSPKGISTHCNRSSKKDLNQKYEESNKKKCKSIKQLFQQN